MKYTAKAKLKYVLVVDKDKSTPFNTIYKIYDAKDSYSGVYYAEGGLTDAEYVSKRNSLVVSSDGKIVSDKINGVWLKETAKPLGSIEKTEAMDLNSASDWENYLKGGSGGAEVELSPNRISKGFYGWKGKTETKSQINGYDWEIVTMKRSNGKLVSDIQGGKIIKGDGYSSFGYTPTDDPSANLIVTTPKVVNEKRVREQHEEAVKMFKELVAKNDLPQKKYAKGGSTDAEWRKRQKMFGFKPYGKTKGRYLLQYIDEGQQQQEIIESKEMAIDTANRYKRIFDSVKIIEPDGNEILFYAKGGRTRDRKYLNKSEDYEVRYAKGRNRKGYSSRYAKGGEMANGGSIGFIPMELEEKLALLAKWGGTDIKGVIGFLNAMIDSHVTNEDLIIHPTKNTRFQRERAIENKIQEIWRRIEPNYKGNLRGNMYYSTLKEMIARNAIYANVLKDFKPFRKLQKDDSTAESHDDSRKMDIGDAILYKDEVWYISEKNGQIGIKNLKQGAWGMDYPFIPLSRLDMDMITDMMGRKVRIDKNYAKGGEIADFKGAGMFAGGGGTEIIPPKGELRNADNHLLKYEKNGSEYEFYVYKPVSKLVSGYEQTKHICVNADCALKMSYKQFINYLYVEGYIDDRKNAKGGYMADGGRLENISPVIKPKIEAIEKILPKALGEGGYMTIIFAFQTKDGYAFNMESKSDYPVNRATPKLKRIGVVVERTGEKGKRLITIPKGVFDQMTTIYMVGGEFADGGIQNHPLNIQIHTKIAEELGREMAARFIITDYSRDSGIGAVRLIEMAIQRGFISLDEINSDIIYSAEEKADESAEMEEIGSSDTNILIHSMLRNAGIEMDYEGNRMVRKYTTPEEANIKSSTHKNEK